MLSASEFSGSTIMYKTEDHQEESRMMMMYDQLNHDDKYSSTTTSGCESSPSSCYSAVQKPRSVVSSPLLPMNINNYSMMSSSCARPPAVHHRLMDLMTDSCSIRRVFSTEDLHQLSPQLSSSSIIEGMLSKACRYNPEEKKERIERYKSKRAHRNFNKKIKYACRKTLADSRPRIRGRFATNNNNMINYDQLAEYDDQEKQQYGQVLDYNNNNNMKSYNNEDHQSDDGDQHQLDDDNWVDLFNYTTDWSTFN